MDHHLEAAHLRVRWDSDAGAPMVLMEVDLGTRTVTRVIPFPTIELRPTIDS